jgi:hypothetical protein
MIACIILVAASTHLRRYWLARRSTRDTTITARDLPRMVVGNWIVGALVAVGTLQALYLVFRIDPVDVVAPFVTVFSWIGVDLPDLATKWKRTIFAIGWISALSLPILASTRLGNFVHIARDLIDHQYSRRRASMLTQLGRSRDVDHWPRRARIQARLIRLLDDLLRDGKFDAAVFVMHSQGSVVMFDYLRDQGAVRLELSGRHPDVVTLGSPLSHLYEHYFLEYASLNKDIAALRGVVGRWINMYRIDDYIGREVAHGTETGVTNEELTRGGHTDYWREHRLGHVLLDLVQHPSVRGLTEPATTATAPRTLVPESAPAI